MDVKIERKCGRCGKSEEQTVSLETAQQLEAMADGRENIAAELPERLNDLFTVDHPDVIIAYRTTEGTYEVRSLSNLCSAPEAKRNKGCLSRVATLIQDLFMETPPAEKKPKKKKRKPDVEAEENN